MKRFLPCCATFVAFTAAAPILAAPVIDPIPPNVSLPAGKSRILPVTASSPNGRPLTFTATSSTNRITVEVHTNNPFWKMSVVQVAPSNAPGAYLTPFRGGLAMVTNMGDMTFMLFKDIAPRAADVISGLTCSGFYSSNTIFHRVVSGFVIQGGDPNTNGSGGPIFRFDDDLHPRALFSGNGQLGVANSGKDTDGSQFFITVGPQRFLDLSYPLFGQLLRGFNVMSNIFNVATNGASRPLADVIITRASLVPNTTDTVLTLAGTNLAGVSATIKIIADDGAGGRVTNSFTATTISDATNNAPPIIYPDTVTNLVGPVNGRLTNNLSALDVDGDTRYWFTFPADYASSLVASNSTPVAATNQFRFTLVPATNYAGPVNAVFFVSNDPDWDIYYLYYPSSYWPPFDAQVYHFAVGDTPISALATNFVALPGVAFTNQILATFTNGVPDSSATNFTVLINWADNLFDNGTITTNANGRKEVRGAHTYTNAGTYGVPVIIKSRLGAGTTVNATAIVPPTLSLAIAGTNSVLRWPAWATDYQLQSHTNLATPDWTAATNFPVLLGYERVATNTANASNQFFRLKR